MPETDTTPQNNGGKMCKLKVQEFKVESRRSGTELCVCRRTGARHQEWKKSGMSWGIGDQGRGFSGPSGVGRVVVSIDAEMIGRSSNGLPAGFTHTRYWQVAPDPIPGGREGRRI